jgi:hypothetical protein
MGDPSQPIPLRAEEVVYRRIPAKSNAVRLPDRVVTFGAFLPTARDTTGISLVRASAEGGITPERAAAKANAPGKLFYVAELTVRGIRDEAGVPIAPDDPADPSHLCIPWTDRNDDGVRLKAEALCTKCVAVHGPFPGGTAGWA